MRAAILALVAAVLLFSAQARAHGLRTAYVEVRRSAAGAWEATARSPVREHQVAAVVDEARLRVDGLGPLVPDAVVHVTFADGRTTSHLLHAASPSWTLPATDSPAAVAKEYARLGVAHILAGADHLLFLLGLVLWLRRTRAVLVAETAFTLSHSVSFSAAALGIVHVSPAAAEACIALSLVLVALDVARGAPPGLRAGAGLAFAFGLVHGLGFAGGLGEIGLPDRDVALALAGFAAGVEVGQLAFVLLVLGVVRAIAARARFEPVATLGAYVVGATGAFWFLQRLPFP